MNYYEAGLYGRTIECIELLLSYILSKDEKGEEESWRQDLFLYYLCKANLAVYENQGERAERVGEGADKDPSGSQ